MTRFRRILVATDLSDRSGQAVRRAGLLAAEHGARLTAVHVVPFDVEPELVDFAAERLRSHVEKYAPEVEVETVVRQGKPASVTVSESVERAADLLVVGERGGHWKRGVLVGSTTENLVRASVTSVLVVKNQVEGAYRTVLLAVEASRHAAVAAGLGTSLTPGADHILVHVSVVVGEHLMRMRGIEEGDLDRLREVSTERVRPRIEELAGDLEPAPSAIKVESGEPRGVLPELAQRYGADLTVVGSGTHFHLGHALLGTVAQHVLRQAPSDVLVARG